MATLTQWIGAQLAGGSYHVNRAWGDQGVCDLYLGLDLHKGRQILIKTIKPDLLERHPDLADRMRQDYSTFKEFYHPNLVHLLDQGDFDGAPFLILTLCNGGNLWMQMAPPPGNNPRPMPPEGLSAWLPGVARALDYLHANGHLHGEVNPYSIQFDETRQVRLSEPSLTRPRFHTRRTTFVSWKGPRYGPPRFFAPEWMEDQPVNARADQFSLALVVYEWLTGKALFPGDAWPEVKQRHEMAGSLPTTLPAPWLDVLGQALKRRPDQRFSSCQDFATNLLARVDVSGAPVDTNGPVSFDLYAQDSRYAPDSRTLSEEIRTTEVERRRVTPLPVPPPVPMEAAFPPVPQAPAPARYFAAPPSQPVLAILPDGSPPSGPPSRKKWRVLLALCLLFLLIGLGGGYYLNERTSQEVIPPPAAKDKPESSDAKALADRLASLERLLAERKDRLARLEDELGESKKDLTGTRTGLKTELELRRLVEKGLESEKERVKVMLADLEGIREEVKKAALAFETERTKGDERFKLEKDRVVKLTGEAEKLKIDLAILDKKIKDAPKEHEEKHFEGIELEGEHVILVVDISGSMGRRDPLTMDPEKWPKVVEAIEKLASSLPEVKKFQVIVFNDKVRYLLGKEGKWIPYDKSAPKKIAAALLAITPDLGTNLHAALEETFKFRKEKEGLDTVFFFSDGLPNLGPGLAPGESHFPESVEKGQKLGKHIRQLLRTNWNQPLQGTPSVRINAIGFFFDTPDLGAFLWALARENGGAFMGMSHP